MIEKPETTSKSRMLELKIYKIIGIPIFRQFILKYEAFRHRKDDLKNRNYHIENYSKDAIERFVGYLVYNSVLHIVSILFTVLYFVIKWCLIPRWNVIDIVMCLVTVFNIACILLQRYNYLRMEELSRQYYVCRKRQIQKQSERILETFPVDYTPSQMQVDEKVLLNMKESMVQGQDYFVTPEQIESFTRMGRLLEQTKKSERPKSSFGSETIDRKTIQECTRRAKPYSKIDKRVDSLQRSLHWKQNKRILWRCNVITVDSECEKAFQCLFPKDSKDLIMKRIEILEEVFRTKMARLCEE